MKAYKVSRFTHSGEVTHNGRLVVALFNALSKAFCLLPPDTWARTTNRKPDSTDADVIAGLLKNGFIVEDTVDETASLIIWKQQYMHDTGTMKSRVLVTMDCNFICQYCYLEAPEKVSMDAETAKRMDAFYLSHINKVSPRRCRDNYLGGEPLLKLQIILQSTSRRYYFCLGKGIDYQWGITTNGYLLTRSAVRQMLETGVTEIRVSLAGPREVHDVLRPRKGGRGTYNKILENLIDCSDLIGFRIECQYDAGKEDYLEIPRMMDELLARGVNIAGIEFSPIFARANETRFLAGVGAPAIHTWLVSEAAKRGLSASPEPPGSYCMADARNYFVFDPLGNILPCPALACGQFAYGNVTDGIDFIKETQILNRHLPEKCTQSCDLAPCCFGGCRLQSYHRSSDFNGGDCHYEALKASMAAYIQAHAASALSGNPQFS